MKFLWKTLLSGKDDRLSVYDYNLFEQIYFLRDTAVYFYGGMDKSGQPPYTRYLSAAGFGCRGGEKVFTDSVACKDLPLAAYWEISQQGEDFIVDTGRFAYDGTYDRRTYGVLKLSEGKLSHCGKTQICEKKTYHDGKIFSFGGREVYIPPKKTRKLECKDKTSGEVLWQFSFVGYLYTEITEQDGVIYFGTAGQGGRFYGLKLADGASVCEINTHGTVNFCFDAGKIYLVDGTGGLLRYDPLTGAQTVLELPEKLGLFGDVRFAVHGGFLYGAAFTMQKKYVQPIDWFAVCIDLEY